MSEAFKIAIDFAVIAAIYILWLFPKWKRMGNPVAITHTLIELIQPLLSGFRASDVTDLITNTAGGLIGHLCYLSFRPTAYRLVGIKTSNRAK